jgi:hypothetical protein
MRRVIVLALGAFLGTAVFVAPSRGSADPGVLPERILVSVSPASTRLHIARDGTVPARIGCPPQPGGGRCFGRARVETDRDVGAVLLTRVVSFSSESGRRIVVRLPLNADGRRARGRNGIAVRLTLTDFGYGTAVTWKPMPLSLK